MKFTTAVNFVLVAALAALTFYILVPDAFAQTSPIDVACTQLSQIYQSAKKLIYIGGGLGILVIGVFAFVGRFRWSHFFALAGGLFLVGVTDYVIQFFNITSSC